MMSDIDKIVDELKAWQLVEDALGDTCNSVHLAACRGYDGEPCLRLEHDLYTTTCRTDVLIREAFLETFNFSLDDVQQALAYAEEKTATLAKELIDITGNIIHRRKST